MEKASFAGCGEWAARASGTTWACGLKDMTEQVNYRIDRITVSNSGTKATQSARREVWELGRKKINVVDGKGSLQLVHKMRLFGLWRGSDVV